MTDEQIEKAYRAWWAESWGSPPNAQAVATAVAFGRHLLHILGLAEAQEAPPQEPTDDLR